MNCPNCGRTNISTDARFCPDCGKSLEIAARIDIHQDIKENLGRVIGVQTGAIHGNVYGGDIYQVQVYVLSETGKTGSGPLPELDVAPYKFLSPYGAKDSALFKGRQGEIRQIVSQIGQQRLVVLYGENGVGKTSLLAAGVIPELIHAGALAFHVRDYSRPLVATLRAALSASSDQLAIDVPMVPSLAELIQSVQAATQGTLILVLDQFERLFNPGFDIEKRAVIINALVDSLRTVSPEYLRLIISVRDDALVRLGDLQEALPDLFRSFIQLQSLDLEQARAAILEPLGKPGDAVVYPVYYETNLVDDMLIPDLADLSPKTPQAIYPPHLQIVCRWLYQSAQSQYPPLINHKLYVDKGRGAEGILASYLEETLRTQLADEKELAERILRAMAAPGARDWVAAETLGFKDFAFERLESVMARLAKAELLIQRPSAERNEYALSSQIVADEIRRLAGTDIMRSYQAGDDLERIWSAWLVHDDLATTAQLRRLAESGAHLSPRPEKCLLLLRSAMARDLPADPWLSWLRGREGRSLLQELEGLPLPEHEWHSSRSQIGRAKMILSIADSPDESMGPIGKEPAERPYGPISQSAVSSPDAVVRQTAALSLLALDLYQAIDRIDWALQSIQENWGRLWRKAELRGTLAEADREIVTLNRSLPWSERTAVWIWRIRRGLFRDRQRILALTLGGAIGAGVGLGALRGLTALLTDQTIGVHALMNFDFGFLLAAALILGKILAEHLLLEPVQPLVDRGDNTRASKWLPTGLSVLLGGLLFAVLYMFVVTISGAISLSGKNLVIVTGILAGLGLSLALAAFPIERLFSPPQRWGLRAGGAAFIFVLLHSIFIALGDIDRSIAIVWPGRTYRTAFNPYRETWPWQQLMAAIPPWFNLLALVDAALAGFVLAMGMMVGMRQANRFLDYWRRLVRSVGD